MKKILLMLSVFLLFAACQSMPSSEEATTKEQVVELPEEENVFVVEEWEEPEFGFKEFYDPNFGVLQTVPQIPQWVFSFLQFESNADGWRSPEEILKSGTCNINDYAILFMNILKVRFDIECNLVIIDGKEAFSEHGFAFHPLIEYQGHVYNVYAPDYIFPDIEILYSYTYEEVFYQTFKDLLDGV